MACDVEKQHPPSRVRRSRLLVLVAVAVVALGLQACVPPPSSPPPTTPGQVAGPVSDYATDAFSDPWDFSNPEDFNTTPNVQTQSLVNVGLNGSNLHLDTPGPGGVFIMSTTYDGSIPWGRDSRVRPIDATTYPDISFSMRSSAPDGTQGLIIWYTCPQLVPACQGMFIFQKTGGANFATYNWDMRVQSYSGAGWSGPIYDLRFQPSNSPASVDLDWIRVHTPTASIGPPANPFPLPVIDSPSAQGGDDFPTVTRGDPWDFNQPSDVASTQNVIGGVGNGVFTGWNTNGDPQVQLAYGGSIDGSVFHHLTVRVWYEGPFGLSGAPGGGMVGRLIWTIAGHPGEFQDSEDIVVYPGWNTIRVDLATDPVGAIVDPNTPFAHYGWWGRQIDFVRFDPHEDPGGRQFVIDDVNLTADNSGAGSYPIRFHDNAWEPGTVAQVFAQGEDGNVYHLGNTTMTGPSGTLVWGGAPAGRWQIFVRMIDPAGQATQRYATGALRIT